MVRCRCHRGHAAHGARLALRASLLFLATLEISSSVPSFQWRDAQTGESFTCNQCSPGTFMVQPCSKEQQTVCDACPGLHFTQYWNYLPKCLYCNVFCGERQVVKHECNATHNRVCECQEGYYLHFQFCIRHSACPPGSGVVQRGTAYEDSRCEECHPGSFSSSPSHAEPCQPHQQCSAQGKEVNVHGNKYQDTLCTSCRWYNVSSSQEDDAGCEEAILQFVAHQDIPVKRRKRLQQLLENNGRRKAASQPAARKKLQSLLLQLRQANGTSPVVEELLGLLRRARLHNIEQRVRRKFMKS
ncbi:tumor necrosis factor receptor superfamily member 6B [Rhinatrema bivittatum]|uniref:tumor necrosis factor receptor superfamily member 6B n=1 Tax=Rhinatrema bivittatum TaxID=194408 RepID=UPI001128676F|nr:tumor necrosis factor receptor superfamily member 6B [Rhinatrema bivittatum]